MADDDLMRGAALDEEGIPELEEQPPGKLRSGTADEGLVPPRDHPIASRDTATTTAGERAGDTFAERADRLEPELLPDDRIADRDIDDDLPAGRVVQPDEGMIDADDTDEELGSAPGDFIGLSAEEEAMHITDDPPGLGGGSPGYVPEEGPD